MFFRGWGMDMMVEPTMGGCRGEVEEYFKKYLMEGDMINQQEDGMKFLDVTEEMKELLGVYEKSEEMLKEREMHQLRVLCGYMKNYLDVLERREGVSRKKKELVDKINPREEDEDE